MNSLVLGTASNAVDLSGVTLPFNVQDLLTTSMSLIGVFGPFILVGVALMFSPQIVSFFKKVLPGGKTAK